MPLRQSRPPGWSRREILAGTSAALLAGSLGCGGPKKEPAAQRRPRNIVLITGDDLGWHDLSSSGNPNVRTPNLDRLRRAGVSFRNAFDVTSTCSSSRTTYATGQYPHSHRVTGLVHRNPELSLPVGTPTLASHLRDAGMITGIEGKWHLAFPDLPDGYGYDVVMTTWLTQVILDSTQAVRFVERFAGERFYLELNYMNPHRDAQDMFVPHPDHPVDPATIVIPGYMHLPDVTGAREELAAYSSQVSRMDVLVGEVLAALESHGLLDDTLITFISDNGAPFPGNKLTLHDRGTGTPWFFHWPAALPAGLERDELVSSVDLMPTLLDVAGIAVPSNVQGRSLLPLLMDASAVQERDAVYSEMTLHTDTPFPMRSVRTARFRYIRNYSDEPVPIEPADAPWVLDVKSMQLAGFDWWKKRVPEELYDLENDPQELVNLVENPEFAGVLRDLGAKLDAHMRATSDAMLGRAFEVVTDAP